MIGQVVSVFVADRDLISSSKKTEGVTGDIGLYLEIILVMLESDYIFLVVPIDPTSPKGA
jgi:hypothetical protein